MNREAWDLLVLEIPKLQAERDKAKEAFDKAAQTAKDAHVALHLAKSRYDNAAGLLDRLVKDEMVRVGPAADSGHSLEGGTFFLVVTR